MTLIIVQLMFSSNQVRKDIGSDQTMLCMVMNTVATHNDGGAMIIINGQYRQCAGPNGELPEALQKYDPQIIEMVCSEVLHASANVQWDDIAGQDAAKRMVQELVVWPMLNPHLFTVSLNRLPPL